MAQRKKGIRLRAYDESLGTAYVELWDHPHELVPGIVKRSVDVHRLIEGNNGPKITFDFDANGVVIGIEILYPTEYVEAEGEAPT